MVRSLGPGGGQWKATWGDKELGCAGLTLPHACVGGPSRCRMEPWGAKKSGTRVLRLYFWSWAVIVRGSRKHSAYLKSVMIRNILFQMSVFRVCRTGERIQGGAWLALVWDALVWESTKPAPQPRKPQDYVA